MSMPKRVLVTGASRGIGRAICLRLAKKGIAVAACASSHADELKTAVDHAARDGGTMVPLIGDLSDPATPARLIEQGLAALGGLDAVVSNAGLARSSTLTGLNIDDWDYVLAVNARAPWLLAKAAYPALRAARGSFVAVASMSGVQPYPNVGAYSPSKACLLMTMRLLAQEWAADGIRVNSVSPGLIRTPMTARHYEDPAITMSREALIPMHRIGEADDDIAGIVEFLIGPDAGYMTGQNLVADGGLLDAVHGLIRGRPRSEN